MTDIENIPTPEKSKEPRPHGDNGKFVSPDPQKQAESMDPGIPATPTNFEPPEIGPGKIESKRIRKRRFAFAIVSGKSTVQAAEAAGIVGNKDNKYQFASRMLRDPIVQEDIRSLMRLLDKHDLGVERSIKEIARGLDEGKIGSHAEYLDKLLKVQGLIKSGNDQTSKPNTNIFQALIIEAERRGQKI